MALLGNKKDIKGDVFGRLTVIEEYGRDKHGNATWYCKCSCGNFKVVTGVYLRNGDTKSCGCLSPELIGNRRRIHGLSRKNNTEYEIWKGMKARCFNPNGAHYDIYGGRGITVCERWKNSFNEFIADMGLRPTPSHSIDRYPDMNGNYEPSNCRWATNREQTRNKRDNRYYAHSGLNMVMTDWATFFKVHPSTLSEHLETKDFEEVYSFYMSKNRRKGNI